MCLDITHWLIVFVFTLVTEVPVIKNNVLICATYMQTVMYHLCIADNYNSQ